jgi:hypothetical protein
MDQELAAEREAARKKQHEEWADSLLKTMVEQYPPSAYEWDIMLMGIRIDRFVSNLECEQCPFGPRDHTVGWLFETKVCLKDYYRKCREWGIKPVVPEWDQAI